MTASQKSASGCLTEPRRHCLSILVYRFTFLATFPVHCEAIFLLPIHLLRTTMAWCVQYIMRSFLQLHVKCHLVPNSRSASSIFVVCELFGTDSMVANRKFCELGMHSQYSVIEVCDVVKGEENRFAKTCFLENRFAE